MWDKLERLVEEWHEGDSEISLRQFLGMTVDEYGRFVRGEIMEFKPVLKNGVPVTTNTQSPFWSVGAVYVSEDEYEKLKGDDEAKVD